MHITEGILSGPVLIGGGALTLAGMIRGVRELTVAETPRTAMVAALCFTAALIHVPIGPASAHLLLNGIAGILLGWKIFPALGSAFLLHAMMFQFGGLTVLGVNTAIAAWPAIAAHYLFRRMTRAPQSSGANFRIGVMLGAGAVAGTIALQATALSLSGRAFTRLAIVLALTHLPVIAVDGAITGMALNFLRRRRPDLMASPTLTPLPAPSRARQAGGPSPIGRGERT